MRNFWCAIKKYLWITTFSPSLRGHSPKQSRLKTYFTIIFFLCPLASLGMEVPISLFSMTHYNQNVDYWINPKKISGYNQSLLTRNLQEEHFQNFKKHWLSTWNSQHVMDVLDDKDFSISSLESEILTSFDNQNKKSKKENYGENFRPYDQKWINNIRRNINLNILKHLKYHPEQRAILVSNTLARALPTNEPSFYNSTLPGEGYPFDNLQMSSLWVGTPVYILTLSNDHRWTMVLTPSLIAWIPSDSVARVSNTFIKKWRKASSTQLAAIIHTKTHLISEDNRFNINAYIGSVFPVFHKSLMLPVRRQDGIARFAYAKLVPNQTVIMPYAATPHHFATLMKSLVGRPYGWGGIYFYNDCSQELQNLYLPFGIWLPRNSSSQVNATYKVDKTLLTINDRIHYLMSNGHPFMTIVYIGGHIFQYIGNFINPNDSKRHTMVMTYQNMWGLSPNDRSRRAVIGQSVFFPLLNQYPEDKSLSSQADRTYFQIGYLDEKQTPGSANIKTDLRMLMLP